MNADRPLAIARSPKARADIDEIWTYIADCNLSAADRVADEIERVCGLIARHPRMGRERPEIARGIRSFGVMSWIIFYRIHDEFIEIVRVIHGARDLGQIDF
jgi:toxin ParE1/3/4